MGSIEKIKEAMKRAGYIWISRYTRKGRGVNGYWRKLIERGKPRLVRPSILQP